LYEIINSAVGVTKGNRLVPNPNKYPLISVVVPSFNQGQYIEKTLLSILGQGYPRLEIIVIDGGSTDNTVEILEKYSNQLFYWHSKKDNGQADAINQGMQMSSGDILCWLNSDDMYLPGTLLAISEHFREKLDEYHLVYGAAVVINESGNKLQGAAANTASFDPIKLTYFDYIVQPSSFWTKKLWAKVGELDINYKYVLDWDWFIRASKIATFEYIPHFYSVCRFHPFHKTSNGGEERREEILDIVNKFASDYWKNLYIETDRYYNSITKTRNFLKSCKIPRAHLFIPFLFPPILYKMKNSQDFLDAWIMLGF
jgi:glycosyltransferase involved in cell wall biosynthesis